MFKPSFMLVLIMLALASLTAVPRELVVVEVGTGTWCQYCPGAAMGCHDLLNNGQPVAVIKNHNGDPYANIYSNARNTLYGISSYPTAKFDGVETVAGGSDNASMYNVYLPKVTTRMAVPSRYTIDVVGSNSGNNYTVQVTVAKPEADSNTNVKLHAVLTESNITQVWFNQTTVENVNRLMVPDQNGTAISLNTGAQTTVELNFVKQASWVAENCELVLFLQNMTSKEILQAIKVSIPELTGGYPLSTFSHDFGFLQAGASSGFSVTIQNYASYTVSGTIGTDNPAFSVSTGVYSIPAYGSQTFDALFNPLAAQDYNGNLLLNGNLWNYASMSIPLSGKGFISASDYQFAISSEAYTPVTGGTLLGSESTLNRWFTDPAVPLGSSSVYSGPGFPIGFDFEYLGKTYNQLGVHTYGWIALGQSALTPSVNLTCTSNQAPFPLGSVSPVTPPHLISKISAIGNSIRPQTGAELRVVTVGVAPNRECVVQWTNYKRTPSSPESFNFQIRLMENGDRVRIVYGDFSFANSTAYNCEVGLRNTPDTVASNFYNLTSSTNWAAPLRGTATSDRMTLSSAIKPTSGLTYTWIPQASLPQAPLLVSPASGVVDMPTGGFDLSWAPALTGAAPEYYAVYLSDDEEAIYDQEYWETATTTFDPVSDGGFSYFGNTRYYWTVQAFNASGSALSASVYRFDTASAGSYIPEPAVVGDGSLGWSAVSGAQSYNIYRAETPYGTYTLVGNTTNPAWTDPDFPASKAFYKVTAVIGGREVKDW